MRRSLHDRGGAADKLIDAMTLSSTHLPFLYDYFVRLYPSLRFLDPATNVVSEVRDKLTEMHSPSEGTGSISVVTTVDAEGRLKAKDFQNVLSVLGLNTEVQTVTI